MAGRGFSCPYDVDNSSKFCYYCGFYTQEQNQDAKMLIFIFYSLLLDGCKFDCTFAAVCYNGKKERDR